MHSLYLVHNYTHHHILLFCLLFSCCREHSYEKFIIDCYLIKIMLVLNLEIIFIVEALLCHICLLYTLLCYTHIIYYINMLLY